MATRRLARQRALQLLYGLEYSDEGFEDAEAHFLVNNARRKKAWGTFPHELTQKTHEHKSELDMEIKPALQKWKLDRLPRLDLLCLRMAVCEFRHFPDIPLRVTLNEYVELAKLFGTEDSPQFINGVLDKLAKKYQHKDFPAKAEEPTTASEADDDDEHDG